MGDWASTVAIEIPLTFQEMGIRLLVALLCGALVALTYAFSRKNGHGDSFTLPTTLTLLTILVAITTIVIGGNLARAFGLVGALSIVRFRTVVEDTRDTAFVIYAVVIGMAVGAGNFGICLIGIPLTSATAWVLHMLQSFRTAPLAENLVAVRVGIGHDLETILKELFAKHLSSHRIRSIESARQGVAFDVQFIVRLRPESSPLGFVKALQQTEGIQSVEWKEIS
jgi:uncharacterized membrane protein YhiD involved in acid resistance